MDTIGEGKGSEGGTGDPWQPDASEPSGGGKKPLAAIFGGAFLLALLAGALWFGLRSGEEPVEEAPPPPPPTQPAETEEPEEEPLDLPELGASDEFLREMAASLSENPEWVSWLATDALVRRFVSAVSHVAAGRSPREDLEVLAPDGEFAAESVEGRTVITPESYERYDLVAAVVSSLDTEGTARLYRQLLPLFNEAHRELGLPEDGFDETFARAVDRVVSVQVPDPPIEVVDIGGLYEYADPALERRSPVAKHLVRMGPENARRVQEKLRELAAALDLP